MSFTTFAKLITWITLWAYHWNAWYGQNEYEVE